MDELLRIFLSWQFIVLTLGIASITFVIRKIMEFIILNNPSLPGNKNSIFWRSLALPILPIIIGGIATFFSTGYPYPELLGTSEFGRVCFGLGAGALSTTLYRVILELLRSKVSNFAANSDDIDYLKGNTLSTTPSVNSQNQEESSPVKEEE